AQPVHAVRPEQKEVVVVFQKSPRDRFRIGGARSREVLGEAEDAARRPRQGAPFHPRGGARALQPERLKAAAIGEPLLFPRRVVSDLGVLRVIECGVMPGSNVEVLACARAPRLRLPRRRRSRGTKRVEYFLEGGFS